MAVTTLYTNAHVATLDRSAQGLGLVPDGAVGIRDGRIAFVGRAADVGPDFRADEAIDCGGRLLTPGLIDCHTHLVHGGERSREFEMRLAGASYEEISRAGGGIASTVAATRATPDADLLACALSRLDRLVAEGVTTVEVKSGYGLDPETVPACFASPGNSGVNGR